MYDHILHRGNKTILLLLFNGYMLHLHDLRIMKGKNYHL